MPKALEAVCLRAMAPRPEERYDAAGPGPGGRSLARGRAGQGLAGADVGAGAATGPATTSRWSVGLGVLLVSLTIALAVNNVMVRREQARTNAARSRAEEASIRATAQQRIAQANEREARLQVARSLVFQGEALALAGQWEPARASYARGGEQLSALGESRFIADVGLWNINRALRPRCSAARSAPAPLRRSPLRRTARRSWSPRRPEQLNSAMCAPAE